MRPRFEELDHQPTPLGEISLRRRLDPTLGVELFEVKLGEEFLMSSVFTVAERELAQLGLSRLMTEVRAADVVVGGLGLGYTAHAALADARVRSVHVVEALPPVIAWHEQGLLPLSAALTADPRCRLVLGDFFEMTAGERLIPAPAPERFHAVLVDIDHTPRHLLSERHGPFYETAGLVRLARHLHPGGVFGLWSDDPPDEDFVGALGEVFTSCEAHRVAFANPLTGGESSNTVYVASKL